MTTDENNVLRAYRDNRNNDDEGKDRLLKVRNVMNIIFMVGAIIGVIYYISYDKITGTYIILGAMAVKIAESALRLLKH